MSDELLDIVNEKDEVIGQEYRSEVYRKKLNFRAIHAFLVNSKKEVWIPRRSPGKKLFPLCLDASVGGHVSAGESYLQAFERELFEELNIVLSDVTYSFLEKVTPGTHKVACFANVYVIYTDVTPNYNPADFIEANWRNISDIFKAIESGEKVKGDLPALINVLNAQLQNM